MKEKTMNNRFASYPAPGLPVDPMRTIDEAPSLAKKSRGSGARRLARQPPKRSSDKI
jgi:hypothetical protein